MVGWGFFWGVFLFLHEHALSLGVVWVFCIWKNEAKGKFMTMETTTIRYSDGSTAAVNHNCEVRLIQQISTEKPQCWKCLRHHFLISGLLETTVPTASLMSSIHTSFYWGRASCVWETPHGCPVGAPLGSVRTCLYGHFTGGRQG